MLSSIFVRRFEMGKNKEGKGLNVSIKSYVTAIAVILTLMILTYALTFIIPGGEYVRIDVNGRQMLDSARVFRNVEGGISLGKWLASPVLVLGAEGGGTIIAIIAFLLVIVLPPRFSKEIRGFSIFQPSASTVPPSSWIWVLSHRYRPSPVLP